MHLKSLFVTLHLFKVFYPRMNKPSAHNTSLAAFQVSKMDLTTFSAQLASIIGSKL